MFDYFIRILIDEIPKSAQILFARKDNYVLIVTVPANELIRKCKAIRRLRRLQWRAKLQKYKTTHIGHCDLFTLFMNDDELFVENRTGHLVTDDLTLSMLNIITWRKAFPLDLNEVGGC